MVVVATVSAAAAAAVAHTTPPSVSIVVPIPFWHLSPLVHVPQMSSRTRAQFHCGTTTAAAVWADTTKTIHNIYLFSFFFFVDFMYQAKYTSSSLAHLRWLFIAAATTIVAAHFASEKADTQAHPYKNFLS